jgi:hypothetical protein
MKYVCSTHGREEKRREEKRREEKIREEKRREEKRREEKRKIHKKSSRKILWTQTLGNPRIVLSHVLVTNNAGLDWRIRLLDIHKS